MTLFENKPPLERAVLVAPDTGDFDAEVSAAELRELAYSAGAEVVALMIQKRERLDTATCIGTGKLKELAEFCGDNEINLIIFDVELSPTQIRNVERETGVRTIDRTQLILDIFASRAHSREGKLQVELAQLQYALPRLGGQGAVLSRLGGGIGTRGPGETQLETDRRHIRRRIDAIRAALVRVERHRSELRRSRRKKGIPTVAIVGYTNAGKSTLMNLLTEAGVLAEDRLFATLDPTARALKLPCGRTVMLIDTVGLVRRLPHHLVKAFRSTLEEAATADVMLNVCDASSEDAAEHLQVTRDLLRSLGGEERPVVTVLNKCDLLEGEIDFSLPEGPVVRISAREGTGIEELLRAVEEALPVHLRTVQVLLPFHEGALAAQLRSEAEVGEEEYTPEGLRMVVTVDPVLGDRVQPYITESAEMTE